MRKLFLGISLISFSFIAVVGHWISIPLNDTQVKVAIENIFKTGNVICDYNPNYGFLISANDAKYLKTVKSIKWHVVEKTDLDKFMDDNKIDTVFHGFIRVNQDGNLTKISIGNLPVASIRFKGQFLCGGAAYFTAYMRLPSVLNFIYGNMVIIDEGKIVS